MCAYLCCYGSFILIEDIARFDLGCNALLCASVSSRWRHLGGLGLWITGLWICSLWVSGFTLDSTFRIITHVAICVAMRLESSLRYYVFVVQWFDIDWLLRLPNSLTTQILSGTFSNNPLIGGTSIKSVSCLDAIGWYIVVDEKVERRNPAVCMSYATMKYYSFWISMLILVSRKIAIISSKILFQEI